MRAEDLRTVKQLAAELPIFTEAALRFHIFHASENGLDRAIVRVGRRLYLDRERLNEWLEARRVAAGPGSDG